MTSPELNDGALMDEKLQSLVDQMKERFDAPTYSYADEISLEIGPERIIEACRLLRDEHSFELLVVETAVDYWPQESPRFHVVYHLYSMKDQVILSLRVPLDGNAPHIPTIEKIYPGANWSEREIWDMFGIRFDGHSDLRRILMPHDWEGFPQRKDYPLGYEEVQFTFNFDEIRKKKTAPKK